MPHGMMHCDKGGSTFLGERRLDEALICLAVVQRSYSHTLSRQTQSKSCGRYPNVQRKHTTRL